MKNEELHIEIEITEDQKTSDIDFKKALDKVILTDKSKLEDSEKD